MQKFGEMPLRATSTIIHQAIVKTNLNLDHVEREIFKAFALSMESLNI
jgi:hypothetical protein